jgi:nucleotide-binding universal stress UspA family protein
MLDGTAEPAQTEERRQHAKEQVRSVCGDEARHLWLKVVEGECETSIIAETEEAGADLIILGDGGKPGWRQRFVGTTTERIVRLSECPVLVVRQPADSAYRRLFCPFDGSPAER